MGNFGHAFLNRAPLGTCSGMGDKGQGFRSYVCCMFSLLSSPEKAVLGIMWNTNASVWQGLDN